MTHFSLIFRFKRPKTTPRENGNHFEFCALVIDFESQALKKLPRFWAVWISNATFPSSICSWHCFINIREKPSRIFTSCPKPGNLLTLGVLGFGWVTPRQAWCSPTFRKCVFWMILGFHPAWRRFPPMMNITNSSLRLGRNGQNTFQCWTWCYNDENMCIGRCEKVKLGMVYFSSAIVRL